MDILIVCTHQAIGKTIARLIDNKDDWRATLAINLEEVLALIKIKQFKVVLIGSGINEQEENKIKQHLLTLKLTTPVIKHYGGGSGLLYAEIYEATKNL